ncbi:MAG: hypothetical protein H0T09_02860 [Actinobacteria bacterium]|nr:hypothetical protein [Actinomycetota bacterium]
MSKLAPVRPFLPGRSGGLPTRGRGHTHRHAKGGVYLSILWIILIIVLVLVLLGFFSRGRF